MPAPYRRANSIDCRPLPSEQVILAQYDFDRARCIFLHKARARSPARPVDCCRARGYLRLSVGYPHQPSRSYAVSRLVWKLLTGRDPDGVIDHINGIRDDNRFENLRDVSLAINAANNHGDLWAQTEADRRRARGARTRAKVADRWAKRSALAYSALSFGA